MSEDLSWAERDARAQEHEGWSSEIKGSYEIENPAEWQHYIDQPWESLMRIHNHIWNDKANFDLKTRDAACGSIRRAAYEVCHATWLEALREIEKGKKPTEDTFTFADRAVEIARAAIKGAEHAGDSHD